MFYGIPYYLFVAIVLSLVVYLIPMLPVVRNICVIAATVCAILGLVQLLGGIR